MCNTFFPFDSKRMSQHYRLLKTKPTIWCHQACHVYDKILYLKGNGLTRMLYTGGDRELLLFATYFEVKKF